MNTLIQQFLFVVFLFSYLFKNSFIWSLEIPVSQPVTSPLSRNSEEEPIYVEPETIPNPAASKYTKAKTKFFIILTVLRRNV